jgi:hypothetical protein
MASTIAPLALQAFFANSFFPRAARRAAEVIKKWLTLFR